MFIASRFKILFVVFLAFERYTTNLRGTLVENEK
jgi:hypothetical protein